jgi:hypothetical protein
VPLGIALLVAMLVPTAATPSVQAAPTIKFEVGLNPEKLGQGTTVSIGLQVADGGRVPPALSAFNILLPAEMGLGGSTLGLDTCSADTLLRDGPGSCPADALMGFGDATADAFLGSRVVAESAPMSVFMAQPTDGHTSLLYYFDGRAPVIAPLVFPSELLAAGNSPRSEMRLLLPVIPGLPGTPDAVITSMHMSLGPDGITYYKRVGKALRPYKPVGLAVPNTCPRGGFPFSAHVGFEDGSRVTVVRRVPCPGAGRHKKVGKRG